MPEGDRRLPSRTLPRFGVAVSGGVGVVAPPSLPTPPVRRDENGHPSLQIAEILADSQELDDSDTSTSTNSSEGEHLVQEFECFEEGGGEGGAECVRPRLPQQPLKSLETITEGDEGCCSSSLALSYEGVVNNSPSFVGTSDYSSSGTEDEEEESTLKLSPGGAASFRLNNYATSSTPSPTSTSGNSEDDKTAVREDTTDQVILLGTSENCTGVGGTTSRAGGGVRLPRLKSMVTNEDLTTTECEEDFQWVRGSSPSYARSMGIEEEEPSVPPPNHPPPILPLPLPPPLPAREAKCASGKDTRSSPVCKCNGSDDEVIRRRRSSRGSNTDSSSVLRDSPSCRESQPEEDMESSFRSTTPRSKHESSPFGVTGGSLDRVKSRRPPPKLRPPLPPSHPPPPLRQRPPPSQNRRREDDRDSSCRCSPASTHSLDGYRRLVDDLREEDDDEEDDEEEEEDDDGYGHYERRPLSMVEYDNSRLPLTRNAVNRCGCPRIRRSRSRSYQRNLMSPHQSQCVNAVVHRHPMCPPSPCCHYMDQEHEDMQMNLPTPYDLYRWKLLLKGGGLVSEFEERVVRLESEKESLRLQVSVLSEQIEAQAEKICDLEKALGESRRRATHTEELLQREMLTRSSLETQKLELLSAASDVRLHHAALERENLQLRERIATLSSGRQQLQRRPDGAIADADDEDEDQGTKGRLGRQRNSREELPIVTSTPMAAPPIVENGVPGGIDVFGHSGHQGQFGGSPSPSPISSTISGGGSPRRLGYGGNSLDDGHEFRDPPPPAPRTPPASYRRKVDHAQFGGTLPRQRENALPLGSPEPTALTGVESLRQAAPRKGVAFAETEKIIEDQPPNGYAGVEESTDKGISKHENGDDLSPQPSPLLQGGKPKGIKKIFGKLKRSGSGNLEDLPEGDFRRGGTRSTAGPRLGWTRDSPQQQKPEPEAPIASWGVDDVCTWLESLGLGAHEAEAKKWGATGAKLLEAHSSDLEKELGIKNPFHRKKIQLAVIARRGPDYPGWDPGLGAADIAERGGGSSVSVGGVLAPLGTGWVLRWLDDVGLPQHKETFGTSFIDARLLHRLTIEEATTLLHITSTLQLASLRRGIQVLRDYNFDPSCLIRRSVPSDDTIRGDGVEGETQTTTPTINPSEVALWTNHRVMEWLRAVDLAEYAPNLRGSGVHGALMVYEPRFTADLLATLLSIPPAKTLLRRHLSTHFKDLVGRSVIGEKREAEAAPGYVPLTATAKVKVAKKSQFTLKRKKSRTEFDFEDLVCPLVSASRSSPDCKPSGDKAGNGDSVDLEAAQEVEDVSLESKKSLGLLCNDNSAHLERTSNV